MTSNGVHTRTVYGVLSQLPAATLRDIMVAQEAVGMIVKSTTYTSPGVLRLVEQVQRACASPTSSTMQGYNGRSLVTPVTISDGLASRFKQLFFSRTASCSRIVSAVAVVASLPSMMVEL